MDLIVESVRTKADLKRFIRFQINLYKHNPYSAIPLMFDELKTLDIKSNPAFDFCDAAYWMVIQNGKVVGRIAAIINDREPRKEFGRIGFMDFIDDADVVDLLITTALDWLKQRGKTNVHGPMGFTDLDRQGLLLEGFDQAGTMATQYNYDYYEKHFDRLGFKKGTDWVEYRIDGTKPFPNQIIRIASFVQEKYGVRAIKIDNKKALRPYVKEVFTLINKSYKELYGYTGLSDRQIQFFADNYFGFLRFELISLVQDAEGKLIGVSITMPSFTKALQKAKGNLLPFGWFHLLQSLRTNDTLDFCLIAVDAKWQNKGVTALMMQEINKGAKKIGIKYAETNIMLEDNSKVLTMWKWFDKKQHKRRRCYTKSI